MTLANSSFSFNNERIAFASILLIMLSVSKLNTDLRSVNHAILSYVVTAFQVEPGAASLATGIHIRMAPFIVTIGRLQLEELAAALPVLVQPETFSDDVWEKLADAQTDIHDLLLVLNIK